MNTASLPLTNPAKDFFDVYRGANRDGLSSVRPSVFHATRKSFAGAETSQIRIARHDCPNRRHIIEKIDGVDSYPSSTGFAGRQGNLTINGDHSVRKGS
jgi:hypothetical protein